MRRAADRRDEVLPGEVRARRALDHGAQIGIGYERDRRLQLGAQRDGRRDDARGATLGRPLRKVERTDPETRPFRAMRPMAPIIAWLLPEPDSPTIATVSLAPMSNDTLRTTGIHCLRA